MEDLLSDKDLEEFTGSSQRKKQAEILSKHGIFYVTRLDGSLSVLRYYINNPAQRDVPSSAPDFSWVDNAEE